MDFIPFEEQSTQDPVPCRKCGTKMNGFDTEQRNNQSYELEVIMETDARSECSDIYKVENNEEKIRLQAAVQSYQDSEAFPESALDLPVHIECLPVLIKVETLAKEKSLTVQPPSVPETLSQMKTTKSKQQLREEFFAPSVNSKANDSFPKKSPGKSKIVNEKPDLKTNSASKIKSQVEVKPNITSSSNDHSSVKSTYASSSKRESSSEEKLPVLKNEIPRSSFKNVKSLENSKENVQSSSKGAKPKSSDSFTTNKNNSTSIGRQRKRATTKTPNRESLETTPRIRRDSDKEDIRRKK